MNRHQKFEQIIRLSPFILIIFAAALGSSGVHASDTRKLEVKAVHSVQKCPVILVKGRPGSLRGPGKTGGQRGIQ